LDIPNKNAKEAYQRWQEIKKKEGRGHFQD
jgi:hypothetical protein